MLRDGLDGLDAIVFPMPDIDSIHYGRDPGFTVVEHPEVEGFSGTEIRRET